MLGCQDASIEFFIGESLEQRRRRLFANFADRFLIYRSARSLRIAVVCVFILVIFFFAVAFVFLFVFFLVGLFPKKDIGLR